MHRNNEIKPTLFNEPHCQFTVEGCDLHEPGSEHYEALKANGINPDANWRLQMSFHTMTDAAIFVEDEAETWGSLRKFRVRNADNGAVKNFIGGRLVDADPLHA